MRYTTHTLTNGLRVVFISNKAAETVTVLVASGTGARFESAEENGMAHFLEHAVFKGTPTFKSAHAISSAIDGIGGELNAYTAKDHTAYYAKVHHQHAAEALRVISDIFLNASLPIKEIDKERGAVIEEINMYADMPARLVHDDFDALMFGAHPLGRTILGPKENIRAFTRKGFMDYRARNYVAANSAVIISGAFDENDMLARITDLFGGAMRTGDLPTAIPYPLLSRESSVKLHYRKTDQTHLVLGVPAFALNHADEHVAIIIATILGGGMSSRLFTEVREKRGLAYYVRADIDAFIDGGYFYARAGVSNDTFTDAVRIMTKEMLKLTKRAVPEDELAKAKEFFKGNMAMSLETTDAQAQDAAHDLLVRGILTDTHAVAAHIDAVTAEDVLRVSKALFADKAFRLAAIGPHKDEASVRDSLR